MTEQTDLDRFLAAWASDVRLPATEVDSIRRQILAEPRAEQTDGDIAHSPHPERRQPPPQAAPPTSLPPRWWQTFSLQVADIVVGAQRQPAMASPLVLLG